MSPRGGLARALWLPFRVMALTVATTVGLALGDDVITTPTPLWDTALTTTLLLRTSTTTFPLTSSCGGLTRCFNDTQCARCLSAINATPGFVRTQVEYYSMSLAEHRAYALGFFETLLSTASCSTQATPLEVLHPALQELIDGACEDSYGMLIDQCLDAEYACFADPDCRPYLAAAYFDDRNGSKAQALRSLAAHALATGSSLLNEFVNDCGGTFPECTFSKQKCGNSSECLQCLATLDTGDGAGSARQCRGTTMPAVYLNNVVSECSSNAVACSFWEQRCADNANCDACLAVMGSRQSALATAADWSTIACQRMISDDFAMVYLININTVCTAITLCRQAVTHCVVEFNDACILCINGSAPHFQAAFCSHVLQQYSIDSACQPCPDSVHTITVIVLITTAVGGASAIACTAVAVTIVAHGYSRVSMWHRIVVGLMLSNAVYSTANAIPLNAVRSGITNCGHLAMSFGAIRAGRAWWFCGKFGLVSFELFILGASIRALFCGLSALPRWAETMMHVACWTCAFVAFAVFYSLCYNINSRGYNANTENEAFTNAHSHVSFNDDLDDSGAPSLAASLEFEHGRAEYDNLVSDMLVAWDVLVGVAVVLWIVLRLMYLHALRMLRSKVVAVSRAEATDVWADTRRSAWAARRRLLEARKEVFDDVAKPLEPYIAVFVAFAVPAVLMSTSFCQAHSGASALNSSPNSAGYFDTNFSYGTCDVWCEFVLAFRSLATVAVYLVPRGRRVELLAARTTWHKLVSRVTAYIYCHPTPSPYGLVRRFDHEGTYEMLELAQEPPTDHDSDGDNGEEVDVSSKQWRINECDVVMVHRLGRGAFGEVWEGILRTEGRHVAIKTLFSGAVDEDGDLVDPAADEDFRKECVALQRIDSTHLIKFFGYGTTKNGNGFIVTELMGGGSLESLLHDQECHLPWRTRVAFGLQIALGMDHLHQRHMLHRDLKSANVLVDKPHTIAKVCDFGLSRVVKPTQRHIVSYSPFTGVLRLLPRVDSVEMNNRHDPLSLSDIAVGIEDARGNMTKAAGTLLWMAPEVFRGDQNYTNAADVYSFGVVLWELATRETPWTEIEDDGKETTFFQHLNSALQTGRRPIVPTGVSSEHGAFVSVMEKCWAGDPADRPTFFEAANDLAAALRSETPEL